MGWREFRAWLRVMNTQRDQMAGRGRTSPDSWRGREGDDFWTAQREKHRRMRGN